MNHVRKERDDDLAITKAVEKSTASARDLLRIASQTDSGKSSNPPCQEQHSGKSSKPPCDAQHSGKSSKPPCVVQPFHQWLMSTPQKSKEEGASNESFMTHRSGISIERENWDVINSRWHAWYKTLMADTTCTPTAQQEAVIQSIHLRTKYEFFVENNLPLTSDIQDMTPRPMCHLIHGLPGAGKSKLLQWLESYWETVWKYERGIHFAFVAYSNSMADWALL